MDDVIREVERDPRWRLGLDASHAPAVATTADAICCALRRVASLIAPAAIVACTASGASCLRASRERPAAPILALTPDMGIARRLALAWGVHPLRFEEAATLNEMVADGVRAAREHSLAAPNDDVVVVAGFPSGHAGSTNLLHAARVSDVK